MRKSWIKKGIVTLITIAIFMAPISAGIKIDKKNNLAINIEKKETKAQTPATEISIEKVMLGENSAKFNLKIKNLDPESTQRIFYLFAKITYPDRESETLFSESNLGPFILPLGNTSTETNTKTLCWGQSDCDHNNSDTLAGNTSYTLIVTEEDYLNQTAKQTFTTAQEDSGQEGSLYGDTRISNDLDLGCNDLTSFSVSSCVAQVVSGIWSITNLLATLAAHILDFFVYYSTNDNSYRNTFISQGWGAVRDIANIFFIIALLYVAIKTVLGLNVTDNKKLISMVILIALIINFSLFTTKLVIDGSNILAKVFYNNITGKDANGKILVEGNGQKSISLGIVQKFKPQNLISQNFYDENQWTSVFIMLITIIVMLYTAYIFISVSLLFVARVASLWISMIFSPIAFASYTVPFDIPGFGHKEWWKTLFENAMLAPLFIFFLYIIILFTGFLGDSFVNTDSGSIGAIFASLMKVVIPFLIIVILLKKAKDLAVKYSGELGGAIMKAGAVIGGLAIGGAAMGVATVGRGTVGAFMKGASTGDTAANRMQGAAGRIATHRTTLANPNSTIVERTHARKEIRREQKDQIKGNIQQALGIQGLQNFVGTRLNQDQHNIEHAAHARHELDTTAAVVAPGKKWDELNGEQRTLARTNMERDRERRAQGMGNRTWANLSPAEQAAINAVINPRVVAGTTHADQTIIQEARVKQGAISNAVQSTVTGSYDARNLSKVVAKEQSTGFAKFTAGITGALASGMRSSLKSTLNINYGEGQKNFFKDLGHTISEAMKGAKINVDLSHVGEQKKEGDKGGGHH